MTKPKKRVNYGKFISRLIIIFVMLYGSVTLYDQHTEMKYLDAQEQKLLENLQIVQNEVQSLKDQIEHSNTDEYIEKIARQHLKMIGNDEIMFIDMGKQVN